MDDLTIAGPIATDNDPHQSKRKANRTDKCSRPIDLSVVDPCYRLALRARHELPHYYEEINVNAYDFAKAGSFRFVSFKAIVEVLCCVAAS